MAFSCPSAIRLSVGAILLFVVGVTLFTFLVEKVIHEFGKKSLIMVKFGVSRNLSLQDCFQRFPWYGAKMTSKGKMFNLKVVKNFTLMTFDIKNISIRGSMRPRELHCRRVQKQFCGLRKFLAGLTLTLPILDGFNHGFVRWTHGDKEKSLEGCRGTQEPLDQRGINPKTKMQCYTLHIDGKPYFWRTPLIPTNLPPPWLPSTRGRGHLQNQGGPSKKGAKGRCFAKGQRPSGCPTPSPPPLLALAASPTWGGTSPSPSTATLHHLPTLISRQT